MKPPLELKCSVRQGEHGPELNAAVMNHSGYFGAVASRFTTDVTGVDLLHITAHGSRTLHALGDVLETVLGKIREAEEKEWKNDDTGRAV